MKKSIVSLLVFLLFPVLLCAQLSVNPEDEFYTLAEEWKLKGYVSELPQLKPYPVNIITDIIEQVSLNGSPDDAADALREYERLFSKPWNARLEVSADGKISQNVNSDDSFSKGEITGEASVCGDIGFTDLFSVGYDAGLYAAPQNVSESDFVLRYTNSLHASAYNGFSAGNYTFKPDININASFGLKNIFVTAGVTRVGFGPFLNSDIVLNPSSLQQRGIYVSYDGKLIDYTYYIASIDAGLNNGDASYRSDKFISFHALRLPVLTPKFKVTGYEAVIFGALFEPEYLLPASYLFLKESNGSADNVMMGVLFEYLPLPCLEWAGNILVDDISVKDALKLNFDSRIRLAAQTGLIYSPSDSHCKLVQLDYTIITPYTYAHWYYDSASEKLFDGSTYNYANYTNHGVCIGASIPPNSDRINYLMKFTPVKRLSVSTMTTYIRHANAYESLTDSEKNTINTQNYTARQNSERVVYSTDGSINTQQMLQGQDVRIDTAWDHLNMLSQEHKMYVFQTAVTACYEMSGVNFGNLSVSAEYMFEYIKNAGVDQPMFDGSYANWTDAYSAWVAQLHDISNNYFTLSVTYTY